jgi:hypothetical protein
MKQLADEPQVADDGNLALLVGDRFLYQAADDNAVSVTAPDSTQTVLVGLRARDGVMEQDPIVDSTFVMHVASELQVGTAANAVRSGTNITNHAQDQ